MEGEKNDTKLFAQDGNVYATLAHIKEKETYFRKHKYLNVEGQNNKRASSIFFLNNRRTT